MDNQTTATVSFFKNERIKQNAYGIFWKLIACAAFAGMNSFVRYLTGGAGGVENPLPPGVVAFFQDIFGCLLMLPFVLKDGIKSLTTKHPKTHIIRIIAAVFGIIALYTAFSKMPMTQVVALQFTGPIFTIIGAKIYLGERIGLLRLSGIAFGVLGAFIITRPDKALLGIDISYSDLFIFLPLISAALFALAKICSRDLGIRGERPQVLALYLLFFMMPFTGVYALYNWTTPTLEQIMLLVGLGACGCVAHYSAAKAYSLAEVVFLTPIGFSRLAFTALLGYLLFFEFPKNEHIEYAILFIILSVFAMTYGEMRLSAKKD